MAVWFIVYSTVNIVLPKIAINHSLSVFVLGLDVIFLGCCYNRFEAPFFLWSGLALHDLQRVAQSNWCGLELIAEAEQLEYGFGT